MDTEFLPWTHLTLDDVRRKLAGWHFAKESLSDGEIEILYIAEALLRQVDHQPSAWKMTQSCSLMWLRRWRRD